MSLFSEKTEPLSQKEIEEFENILKRHSTSSQEAGNFLNEIYASTQASPLNQGTDQKYARFKLFLSSSKTSKLFEVEDDRVAVMIMKLFDPDVWKIDSRSENLQETLLHYFITTRLTVSLRYMLSAFHAHMKEMVFETNSAKRSPLREILTSLSEDLEKYTFVESLWNIMKEADEERLRDHFRNFDKDIMYICAKREKGDGKGKKGKLLLEIARMFSISEMKDELLRTHTDDRSVLDLCEYEIVLYNLLKLLTAIPKVEHTLKEAKNETKRKNLLHYWGAHDFDKVIDLFRRSVSPSVFIDMIFEKSKNGSTPLMVCASHGSKRTLQYLLCSLTVDMMTWPPQLKEKRMEILLHHKNTYGNTLLNLVLKHNEALEVSKHILLEWEKVKHKVEEGNERNAPGQKQRKSLTRCMRSHLKQSFEVQEALDDVDHSLQKKKTKKVFTWVQVCFKTLLIPLFFLCLDAVPDMILVEVYRQEKNKNASGSVNLTSETLTTRQDVREREFCQSATFEIPEALDNESKFHYSLAFVISPWVFYLFEYYHSPHCEMSQTVGSLVDSF